MTKNKNTNKRGKPQEWTDEQLKDMALEIKYKNQGKKLTPSLLQKETGVGRNTWSRRMKVFIEELNRPVLPTINLHDNNEITLPSIDLIFRKYGNDQQALKNELINIELLIYDLYNELRDYKLKDEQYKKSSDEVQSLKNEINKQKKRADHYEQLYNTVTVSSVYPHLQNEKGTKLYELGIKDNLIDFNNQKEKNMDLQNLSSHFPSVSEESIANREKLEKDKKSSKNMKELRNKFDV